MNDANHGESELARLIVESLNLEGVEPQAIEPEAPLFGDGLEDYYWQYDNAGLRVAQLRFYPIPTNVN